jgi:hypothetical protein
MLSVLRGLRRKLIEEGKLKSYLAYAIGEIVLIVAGILIALTINDWNEQRKNREVELRMLSEIEASILSDQKELSDALESVRTSISRMEALLNILKNPTAYHDSLDVFFGAAYGVHSATLNTAPYEAIKAGGLDRISNDELRLKLIELFDDSYKRIVIIDEVEIKVNLDILRPYYYQHFTDIRWSESASPLNYQRLVKDVAYRNLVDYHMNILKLNHGWIYEQALTQIAELLEMLDFELGDKEK